MTNGEVTATSLNLRSAPDGDIIGTLPRGTRLLIAGERGDWLDVEVGDQRGVVSARSGRVSFPISAAPSSRQALTEIATGAGVREQFTSR